MKTRTALLAALAALAANAVQMATENWVSNRLTEATAPIRESVAALNSATQTMQAAIVSLNSATQTIQTTVSDFATNTYTKAETDAKIVELSPAPGNYATVSNRAMTAIQSHQSLQPSTNYTDAALGAFASTGAVSRAAVYGTPTRWTDATGCVWEVATGWRVYTNGVLAVGWTAWDYQIDAGSNGGYYGLMIGPNEDLDSWTYPVASGLFPSAPQWNAEYESVYDMDYEYRGIVQGDTIRAVRDGTNLVGCVALTNDISKAISTNNAAFVSAVLAAPLVGTDSNDLSELAEYGSYGTVGAAILALIAGLAALKRRIASAETSIGEKASLTDLPYALVTPGEWTFSGVPDGVSNYSLVWDDGWFFAYYYEGESYGDSVPGAEDALELSFIIFGSTVTATRPSLPGHLCDRAGNRVVVSGDTTLTLPAAVPGYIRDFLVRLEISGSTVPTVTFAAPTGETITYETDGDEFPVPDAEGTWLYSFTETAAHKFAVSLKKVNEVAQGGA